MSEQKTFASGQQVWVVERDEDGTACVPGAYYYLASVEASAIVAQEGFEDGLGRGLMYLLDLTTKNFDAELCVFPLRDVYHTRAEARAAYREEIKKLEVGAE